MSPARINAACQEYIGVRAHVAVVKLAHAVAELGHNFTRNINLGRTRDTG